MNIENKLTSAERLKDGIFFTGSKVVEDIQNHFDFTKINTVIDSAAGSCNFLINLAKQYPNKFFYGIEKNKKVFQATFPTVSQYKNIKYFLADVLFDKNKFNEIPKCDLYLGNPPFINFTDLEDDYKEKVKPLWLEYFNTSKGFKMLLGESRGDISQLIFYFTIKNFLKQNGQIGVVLPNSLIKGNETSIGFREFYNISVKKIVDISNENVFENTNRKSFFIIAQKGEITKYPIPYIIDNKKILLEKIGSDLIGNTSFTFRKSFYQARQGINTLGANHIFFFKEEVPFESELIYPLYKSSDIQKWKAFPSYKVLMPYKEKKILEESEIRNQYPQAYKYLLKHKSKLESRKSRFIKKYWYALFGIGDYTFSKYKVIWRALGATQMNAVVVQEGIPNQAMHCYISTNNKEEAYFICGIMNSNFYNRALLELNESGAKSFAQPSTIQKIYISQFNNQNSIYIQISKLAKKLHQNYDKEIETKLDKLVENYYKTINYTNETL